jgi:hypothetical protein
MTVANEEQLVVFEQGADTWSMWREAFEKKNGLIIQAIEHMEKA